MDRCRHSEREELELGYRGLKMFLNDMRQKQDFILGKLCVTKEQVVMKYTLLLGAHIKSTESGYVTHLRKFLNYTGSDKNKFSFNYALKSTYSYQLSEKGKLSNSNVSFY